MPPLYYRRRRLLSSWDGLVRLGLAQAILPTTDTGFRQYGNGRLFLPALTNLVTDPRCKVANGTYWPASTAHTVATPNVSVVGLPPLPAGYESVATCLKLENDGTADAPVTANIAVTASKDYTYQLLVFAPALGGNLTITCETGHVFTLVALTGANAGWYKASIKASTVAGETVHGLKFAFAGGTSSIVYVTAAALTQTAWAPPWFCGANPGCAWTSAADGSASTLTASSLVSPGGAFGAMVGTIALRYVPLFPSTSGQIAALVYGQPGNCLQLYLSANKFYAKVTDGTHSPWVERSVTWAVGDVLTVVARFGANVDLQVNGVPATPTANTAVGSAPTSLQIGSFSPYMAQGYVASLLVSPEAKSDAWMAAIQANGGAAFSDPFGLFRDYESANDSLWPFVSDSVGSQKVSGVCPFDDPTPQIICDGNSMTYGTGGTSPYPAQLATLLPSCLVTNVAVESADTPGLTSTAPTRITPLYSPRRTKNIAVIWEGTNDIYLDDTDGTTAYNRLVTYCQARRASGFKVIICTLLPRSNIGTPEDFETQRQTCNGLITANWATFADALADFAADGRIGDAGDELDTTYYPDKVHMTNAGYAIIAGMVKTAVESLL
jgi:lysophospholipase L1-like esterase